MALWNHSEELVNSLWDLVLGSIDGDDIACLLGAWECDLTIPFLLELFDLGHASDKLTVVQTVNVDVLGNEFGINLFNHVHNFLLHELEVVGIARWSTADNIVDLDIIIVLADATAVHGIGEFDEDGVLLHNALNVLATDTNDTLVVLIRNVERDRGRHFKLYQIQTVLGRLVLGAAHVDVKVVLVPTIKDNLDIALAHDLVDLSILLATDKLFMLVRELNLDT